MVRLVPFTRDDFDVFISWIDSEDLLFAIAGPHMAFPLTHAQLQTYLDDPNSLSFTVVDETGRRIGHAEIVSPGAPMVKIDKLIVGDRSMRGKGIGEAVMRELLHHAFTKLYADSVELNVFGWNVAGIRCYQKCGFAFNPGKEMRFLIGGRDWIALNMTVSRTTWLARREKMPA